MKVYNLNEITDSKILYDKNPPAFMKYIILIVIALIALGLVWANNFVKTYMVKGQGLVISENKSHIMTKSSGEINEVFIEEGTEVSEGDILFTTNSLAADVQLEQVNSQVDTYNNRIQLLIKAEENATNGTNNFDKDYAGEKEFYNRLNVAYYARKAFDVDTKKLKDQGYEENQIEDFVKTQKDKSDEHYFKNISEFTSERNQYELEVSKLIAQKGALENSKDQYEVTAQKSGTVHLSTPVTTGMVLQGGSLIGTITNKEESLIIETMLPSSDRPRIHVDDEVSLVVGGLLQSEYGTISGKVISIDEDATIDNEKGNVYFKVKVKPDKTYLEDTKGEKVNLTIGVVTETRVKYEKITYMRYFLELIGVKCS
ncbi:HlyD family secretion protein [Clostridium algidicarnis]|uniref:HlyD family secretion protein n=1 Tax=Clostridium algidicarnis TaxID=37659 RepID=UPI001C0AB542|nr:HlyD family efflux transporter periplasmic adaptor subunit [Clostridium algidicarnis]MBU3229168.1 HlyD family secretion protein [Clostridium algidicarnis]MBU3252695.1 HlyD family secretion protein [Clostridium algidicarnis]